MKDPSLLTTASAACSSPKVRRDESSSIWLIDHPPVAEQYDEPLALAIDRHPHGHTG